ncbi:GNAT family N-acetyltransferase [Erwinia sp. OLTSP20]|uniref:GNAT family N-acetyltransferase n=1 Tax=unclassified Erwinia TaxID=2622719 RepID=UPI000C17D6ED|nr:MULTISPECIES: GNAT family N-acetyltransferase [unclassified Erwinia]PIJ50439.1 GNAT family N-acetyltransferase [Erwinia sp. OAMSP11]PIJ72510.1 GNAT family N-acetyltransferase [Erwinia sp. OLSSP12]PIJ81748.1 GNAT family N-acetyltransferase [Erwinia sp. OLCASP19]PIJ84341.1 GNAT family N-acetyltransferase [Erwinia sp. OLMTSP26]PIJ86205.1 GNAT family N-acetyltransferase [Erwinia sp. OLMDSP33]
MRLYTERLCLRPVSPEDSESLFAIYGDPATNQFNPAGPFPDREHADLVLSGWLAHWRQHGFGNWAISLRQQPDKTLGFGGIARRKIATETMNNLGYRFARYAWGQGLATEFARVILHHSFHQLNMPEVAATVRQNHLASQRVLQKVGLKVCGQIDDVPGAPVSLLFRLRHEEWRVQTYESGGGPVA